MNSEFYVCLVFWIVYFKLIKWRQPHKVSVVSRPAGMGGGCIIGLEGCRPRHSTLYYTLHTLSSRRRLLSCAQLILHYTAAVEWSLKCAVRQAALSSGRVLSSHCVYCIRASSRSYWVSIYRSNGPAFSTRFSLSLTVQDTAGNWTSHTN